MIWKKPWNKCGEGGGCGGIFPTLCIEFCLIMMSLGFVSSTVMGGGGGGSSQMWHHRGESPKPVCVTDSAPVGTLDWLDAAPTPYTHILNLKPSSRSTTSECGYPEEPLDCPDGDILNNSNNQRLAPSHQPCGSPPPLDQFLRGFLSLFEWQRQTLLYPLNVSWHHPPPSICPSLIKVLSSTGHCYVEYRTGEEWIWLVWQRECDDFEWNMQSWQEWMSRAEWHT